MDDELLINVINETIKTLQELNYKSPTGGILIRQKNISERRLRKLKQRLKKISKTDYEKYKQMINIIEYHLLFLLIVEG